MGRAWMTDGNARPAIGAAGAQSGPRAQSFVELDLDLRPRPPTLQGDPRERLIARVLDLERGAVELRPLVGEPDGWCGLLVLDGHLLVELAVGRGHAGWLIGEGDLLRPWDLTELPLNLETSCRVLTQTRVALLDRQFALRFASTPQVVDAMLTHATRTAHWLLAKSLIVSCPKIEERLVLLLSLLGERWGKVTSQGVRLELPLTHEQVASLCGARRPSVTISLRQLVADGVIERTRDRGWLLRRHEPEPLDDGVRWGSCAPALGFDTELLRAVPARAGERLAPS